MKPHDLRAPVTDNLDLGHGYYLTSLLAPGIAGQVRPGQFVMVGTTDPSELLLRRPFSVALTRPARNHSSGPPEEIQLLYRVVGRGTALFSRLGRGAELAVLGPLGNGFTMPEKGDRPVLVAGGIGIAAFPIQIETLVAAGFSPILCYGGRTSRDLTMMDWFRERCEVHVATDDGSVGEHGFVTQLLERLLDARAPADQTIRVYACGPEPMLRAVAGITETRDIPSEASLEAFMACGFGVCLGCVVEVRQSAGEYGRFRRICYEGPVFPTREIVW
jgi:dihydroorotate dehydrogenase electron transfer subunit